MLKAPTLKKNKLALAKFLAPIEVLTFDDKAAQEYGQIRATFEKAGKPTGPLDTLIAAHAFSLSCILVTNNINEFERVTELQLENWA